MPQRTIDSPIGPIRIASEGGALTSLHINAAQQSDIPGDEKTLDEAVRQLNEYFCGTRTHFDLRLAPSASARGETLRAAIVSIPHGHVARYGEVAGAAGSGARAVGQACARNPLPVIIPCHRVLAANG